MLEWSDQVFLELDDQSSISYRQADLLSAQLANQLACWGIRSGDRITVQVEKSPQVILLYLACLRAGIVFHPLNTAYTLHELEYFLNDARPSLLVCDPSKQNEVETLAHECQVTNVVTLDPSGKGTMVEGLDKFDSHFSTVEQNGDDTALLVYTSGTTGKPKGAMITHKNLEFNAKAMVDVWLWKHEDVLLHVLPLFHVHGLCFALHCPMMLGSRIIFQSKFSVDQTIQKIPTASAIMAVPTVYTRLLSRCDFDRNLCQNMRIFISGSAPLQAETFTDFRQRTGHRIVERYGMTEAQIITSNSLDGPCLEGSVGYPLSGVKVRITDENGCVLKHGETGMLEVFGPNIFKGYWQNSKASEAAFTKDGYFITGDLAMVDEQGVVSIVGRGSDMIVAGGFNIYPREVELRLNQISGVTESAVFGVPHADLGEAAAATVVTSDSSINESSILDELQNTLSAFKLPKTIVFLDELPRNAMGKVEKNKLRKRYKNILT